MTATHTIPVPTKTRGEYLRHVIDMGHVPGVLSGAELKGKAKKYGAGYARQRVRAALIVAAHGFSARVVLLPARHRWCAVWVDAAGQPVELTVVTEGV